MGIFSRLRTLENKSNQLRVDLASHLYMDKVVSCGGVDFKVKAIMINKDDEILLCGGKTFEIFKGWRHAIDYPIKVKAERCKLVNNEKIVITDSNDFNSVYKKQKADEVVKSLLRTISSLTNLTNDVYEELESVILANEFLDSE